MAKGDIYIDTYKIARQINRLFGVIGRSVWKLVSLPFALLEWAIDNLFSIAVTIMILHIFGAMVLGVVSNELGGWQETKQAVLNFIAEAGTFYREVIKAFKNI